jgi:hypothetical protein
MISNAPFHKAIAATLLAVFIFTIEASAARNPLSTIDADGFDAQSGGIKTEACVEGGQNLCSIHDGDYAMFKGCDFDSGVAAFKARIAARNQGSVEIRLDRPTGILIGRCAFENTGGWQDWRDITCKVDNAQAGVRDVYLIFRGDSKMALVNVRSFIFLKSIATSPPQAATGFPDRVDAPDDEPQATVAWGMPENGFTENFENGNLGHWLAKGITISANADGKGYSAESRGTNLNFAFTPDVHQHHGRI